MIDRRACLIGGLALPLLAAARRPGEPLKIEVLSLPEAVRCGGKSVATYELTLRNLGKRGMLIDSVTVCDPAGAKLAIISGDNLVSRLVAPGPWAGPAMIAEGRIATLYLELPLPSPVPASLTHVIDYREVDFLVLTATQSVALDITPIPVLAAPLRGGPWVAVHAPEWPRGHRRVIYTIGRPRIPGRHAIDFVLADAGGRIARGDADVPANALGYGADVLAVADARVAAVRDGMAESPSVSGNPAHRQDEAAGNFVSLDLGHGRYAIYEHLKPGSIRVKKGDRVRIGQMIAALGFTGDTTGPHLHFHVADAALPLLGEGKGFVFDRFELLGSYPDLGDLGSKPWKAAPAICAGERPGSNSVVRFA